MFLHKHNFDDDEKHQNYNTGPNIFKNHQNYVQKIVIIAFLKRTLNLRLKKPNSNEKLGKIVELTIALLILMFYFFKHKTDDQEHNYNDVF